MHPSVAQLRGLATSCRAVALLLRTGLTPDQALQAADVHAGAWAQARSGPHTLIISFWDFSLERGLAPAAVMNRLAEFIGDLADRQRDAELHLVGPRAARRLILWLPVASVFLASFSGFAVIPFLFGTLVGWLLMGAAGMLMVCARWWSNRLIIRAGNSSWAAGMPSAVLAQCLRAGVAAPTAVEVGKLIPIEGYYSPADAESDMLSAYAAIERGQEWGVPAAALLDAQAELAQRRESERLREVSERLAVSILIPLGVCVLPAFIVVGVVPIVAVMLSSTSLK
jgi:tight adherence protein B